MAGSLDDDAEIKRNRRTLYLLIGGVLSLLLPLAGVLYMRLSDAAALAPAGQSGPVFSRRGVEPGSERKIVPAAAPAAPLLPAGLSSPAGPSSPAPIAEAEAAPESGSLGFVRGGDLFAPARQAEPPAPAPAVEAAAPAEAPKALADAKVRAPAPEKKPFTPPKLKPISGFSDFRSRQGLGQGPSFGSGPSAAGSRGGGAPIPPEAQAALQGGGAAPAPKPGSGADLPKLGQLSNFGQKSTALQQANKQAPAGADPAQIMGEMPDIQGMLNQVPKGEGVPDVSGMLKGIPGLDPKKK